MHGDMLEHKRGHAEVSAAPRFVVFRAQQRTRGADVPFLKRYKLFISHAWDYNETYHRLLEMLNDAPNFRFDNYSVPEHDPLNVTTDLGLTRELYGQMRPSSAVLILAGMYANYRYWIQKEIEIAQELDKPIIGIIPWGQERTPAAIQEAADIMVRWNTASIVDAIRSYAL